MGGRHGPPPPDSCNASRSTALSALEVGPELLGSFEPWQPEDTAYITQGPQGGYMIVFAIRVPGEAPECLSQESTVVQDGNVIAHEDSPLKTYDAGDGTRTTRSNPLVFADGGPPLGSQVVVTSVAGNQTATSTLTIVQDRNKLDSLTVLTESPHVGAVLDFELRGRVAPSTGVETLVMIQVSAPSVLSAGAPGTDGPAWAYLSGGSAMFQGTALSAGTATVTAKLNELSISAEVTVAP